MKVVTPSAVSLSGSPSANRVHLCDTVIAALLVLTLALVGGLIIAEQSRLPRKRSLSLLRRWRPEQRTARTALSSLGGLTLSAGAVVEFSLENSGSTKLVDFDTWDVIVQYESVGGNQIAWLPYVEGEPGQDQWSVAGIYLDTQLTTPELWEPNVVNPGEVMTVRMQLHPPVKVSSANLVTLVTDNGVSATAVFTR